MNRSVVQGWVWSLSLHQQALILLSLRHWDSSTSEDPSRVIIKELRAIVFQHFESETDAMIPAFNKETEDRDFRKMVVRMCNDYHNYPLNFFKRLLQASAIIGYKHPDFKVRKKWNDLYVKMANVLNLQIESEDDINNRLG